MWMTGIRYMDRQDPERAAQALLCGVEYAASAVLLFGEDGACVDVYLFDTMYGGLRLPLPSGTSKAWLISNHPEGREALYTEDERHAATLCALLGARCVRLFLAGEMLPCREIL